jgi:hypothetical protein
MRRRGWLDGRGSRVRPSDLESVALLGDFHMQSNHFQRVISSPYILHKKLVTDLCLMLIVHSL